MKFKKLIIRATRGTTLVYDFPLEMPDTERIIDDNYDENKRVVILAFQSGDAIANKLNRILTSFEG